LAATLDYLMGEFNGGCSAADGCWEQPLLAVILQEGNVGITRRGLTCSKAARQYPVGVDAIVRLFSSNRLFSKKPITILFHDSLTELCLLPE
jgi:hypothetical protein